MEAASSLRDVDRLQGAVSTPLRSGGRLHGPLKTAQNMVAGTCLLCYTQNRYSFQQMTGAKRSFAVVLFGTFSFKKKYKKFFSVPFLLRKGTKGEAS